VGHPMILDYTVGVVHMRWLPTFLRLPPPFFWFFLQEAVRGRTDNYEERKQATQRAGTIITCIKTSFLFAFFALFRPNSRVNLTKSMRSHLVWGLGFRV
jgi:hypothetical protein